VFLTQKQNKKVQLYIIITDAAKLINKGMILWAGIIKERIHRRQCEAMNFIIDHALQRVTKHLRHFNKPY